jgi:uncharacterized protein
MKWTIYELIKKERRENELDEMVDITPFLENTDIIRSTPIRVQGYFDIYDNEEFVFDLHITGSIFMSCALTLKEVEYPIDIETQEVFTTFKDDDTNFIEGITIDLLPVVWSNILLDKPMRVISEGAYDEVSFETEEFEPEHTNAFANLKKNNK